MQTGARYCFCSGFDMPGVWEKLGKMGIGELSLKCRAYPIISVSEELMRGTAGPCCYVAVSQQSIPC